jgi:putative methionine-R-sulfoxide reductase with GAF domain
MVVEAEVVPINDGGQYLLILDTRGEHFGPFTLEELEAIHEALEDL